MACCRALGQFGLGLGSPAEAESAVSALMRALDDNDAVVRKTAVECLHEMGPKAARTRDSLIRKLRQDPSFRVRWQAARTLTQVEKNATAIIPALIAAIEDEDSIVRIEAMESLGKLQEAAIEAVPALRQALQDRDYSVRQAAVEGLGKVGPSSDAVVPSLLEVLRSDPIPARRDRPPAGPSRARASRGSRRSPRCGRDADAPVRSTCHGRDAQIAPADPKMAAILVQVLRQDGVEYVRRAAAEALKQIISEP